MRAVVCREAGPPESLEFVDRPSAPCGPGQIRVAVRAAGLNFVDSLIVAGRYQIKPQLPFTPGSELAGEVTEVGEAVDGRGATGIAVGDRILASIGLGAFAEEVVINATQAIHIPGGVSNGQAATLGQSYCTALFSFRRRIELGVGQTVLVLGAGGGVGLAAIDVAVSLGARVIAAASSAEKLALARAAGAHEVVDYSTEPLKERVRELTGGGVDVAYDPVGGELADAALRALGENGQLLVIGFASGTIPKLPANQILLRNRSVIGVDWGSWALSHPDENAELMNEALHGAAAGIFHPTEPFSYPLESTSTALRDLLERRIVGKAVLVP